MVNKLIIAIILLISCKAYAIDMRITTTIPGFWVCAYVPDGSSISNLDTNATGGYDYYNVNVKCGNGTTVTMDETGDTVVSDSKGCYYVTMNDTFTQGVNYNIEDSCKAWIEGESNLASLIEYAPTPIKAIGATMDMTGIYKQITVTSATTSAITSTSGLAEASNKDYVGAVINCPNATATDNRPVFLRVISFNPATDTITLNGLFPSALSANDVCNVYIDTVR